MPTHTFSNRSKQLIAVNRRIVKSGILQKAITQSYRDLIPHQRHPLILLNLEAPKSSGFEPPENFMEDKT